MIYIHIPYCKQKCSYCNFHFSTSPRFKDEMLFSIIKELELRHHELLDNNISTIYFGGGTPSVYDVDDIQRVIDEISRYYSFSSDLEVTLEANPDDLTKDYVTRLSQSTINRLSIGVQSFFDDDLQLMNRAHTSSEADSSIKRVQDQGLTNISVDLIYGSPMSNFEQWKENLNRIIELQVPHVSSYALTIEPKTALQNWVNQGKVKTPDEALQNDEFYYMSDFLKDHGFSHYEISNFAKDGFVSKHNSSYWDYKPYLGLGPSAHSYDGHSCRSWNVSNNKKYIDSISTGILANETENLSLNDRVNEFLMIGLRTKKGADINVLKTLIKNLDYDKIFSAIHKKIDSNELQIIEDRLSIPESKWFLADGIAADLFLLD